MSSTVPPVPALDPAQIGAVYEVPAYATLGSADPYRHRHIVLGLDHAAGEVVMVFGTSNETQCRFGAPCFALDAPPGGPVGGGVEHLTHFCGSRLRRALPGKLETWKGQLGTPWLDAAAERVAAGLGIGTGAGHAQRRGYACVRGQLVRLSDTAKEQLNTRFAVLLTCHDYAAERSGSRAAEQEDVMVPLYDTRRQRSVAFETHWIMIAAPWGPRVTGKAETTAFAVAPENVTSLRRGDPSERHASFAIAERLNQWLTDEQLAEIERGVWAYLFPTVPMPTLGTFAHDELAKCPIQYPTGIGGRPQGESAAGGA